MARRIIKMTKTIYTFKLKDNNNKTFSTIKENSIFDLYNDIRQEELAFDEFEDLLGRDFNELLVNTLTDYLNDVSDPYFYNNADVLTILAIELSVYYTGYICDYLDFYTARKMELEPVNNLFNTDENIAITLFKKLAEEQDNITFTIEEQN